MHFFLNLELGRTSSSNPAFDQVAEDRRTVQVVGSGYSRELGKNFVPVVWVTTHIITYALGSAKMNVFSKVFQICL
jgi:hypothetical protein